MKLRKISNSMLVAAMVACLWGSACSKTAANQVLVSVSPASDRLVVTQQVILTAFVTGATDVSATFACTFTTTPLPTSAVPSPKASTPAACTSDVGTLSSTVSTSTTVASTATFTAPTKFPDPVKFPTLLITITATANADKKKTGTALIAIDSGIRLQITPATATLATGDSLGFFAKDFSGNAVLNSNLKWDVTADATVTTASKTCTPTCGTITTGTASTGSTYTAPAAVPTQATATIFATSTVDPSRIGQAAVTIVKAGDITFSGISPSVAPQGGFQQDIFLAATNATSQIGVTLGGPSGNIPIPTAQIKVIFPPGSSTASIGARLRLKSDVLAKAGHYVVTITPSNPTIHVLPPGASFGLDVVPVRPAIVGASPDNFQEQNLGQSVTQGAPLIGINGGFFGDPNSPTVAAKFNDGPSLNNSAVATARQVTGTLPTLGGGGHTAGLYPLSVTYSALSPAPSAFTNIAVIPDYGGSNPPTDLNGNPLSLTVNPPPANSKVYVAPSPLISFGAASAPSGIAIDAVDALAVVTLAGVSSNNVQIINLAGGTPSVLATLSSGGNLATGVAVDDQLTLPASAHPNDHVAAVVNYADRNLSILQIPSGAPVATVDLSKIIPLPTPPNPAFLPPFPYSVGIDPFSHRALVAFASTNVGLILNLDPNATPKCILPNTAAPYCPIAYVTLSTGSNPQVALESSSHLAYVTPGGTGLISGVDLNNSSGPTAAIPIASAKRASNLVTITTPSASPINLSPGNPGTVLISGLPPGTNNTNFNGSFSVVNVIDSNNFQYSQADVDDSTACAAPVPPATIGSCFANSGTPFLTYQVSPSITGIAWNPVSRNAVLADPNVTFGQISFIEAQSQSGSSMSLFAEATGPVGNGSQELGSTDVAFQPFSNTALSFNPKRNEVSLLDPTTSQRAAIVQTGQNGLATVCAANCTSTAPPPSNVSIAGAVAVDSVNNVALVLNSGSGTITAFKLGGIKPVHIERVITPAFDDATKITTPANFTPGVKITSGVAPTPAGPVKILGAGFTASSSQVRLDGLAIPSGGVTFVSSQELHVTIPVTIPDPNGGPTPIGILTGPHHFALDVDTAGVISNVVDFTVVEEIPLNPCSVTTTTPPTSTPAAPGGVAIDELHNLALVTNTGCHQVSVISLDPAGAFGTVTNTIQTGGTPTGVAVLPRLAITGQPAGASGVAVVTNNSANTVTILDLVSLAPVAGVTDVAVGTSPSGVAINQETNLAVIANTGSSNVSTIDLTPLTASPIGKLAASPVATDPNPIAVAIDPDRGTNGRGLAVVTCSVNGAFGVLDGVDIGSATPVRSATATVSGIQSTPTGIVFDPAVSPALFYATSTQGNQITAYNPDTNQTVGIKVGINPTAIAYNFQTGTILTVNALSNTASIVDSQTFRTRETVGLGGASRFSAAIHSFTNLAVIADQANNRVLLFPLPK